MAILDRDLVDGKEFVSLRLVKVNQFDPLATQAVIGHDVDLNAFDQHPVSVAIGENDRRLVDLLDPVDSLFQHGSRHAGTDLPEIV